MAIVDHSQPHIDSTSLVPNISCFAHNSLTMWWWWWRRRWRDEEERWCDRRTKRFAPLCCVEWNEIRIRKLKKNWLKNHLRWLSDEFSVRCYHDVYKQHLFPFRSRKVHRINCNLGNCYVMGGFILQGHRSFVWLERLFFLGNYGFLLFCFMMREQGCKLLSWRLGWALTKKFTWKVKTFVEINKSKTEFLMNNECRRTFFGLLGKE